MFLKKAESQDGANFLKTPGVIMFIKLSILWLYIFTEFTEFFHSIHKSKLRTVITQHLLVQGAKSTMDTPE